MRELAPVGMVFRSAFVLHVHPFRAGAGARPSSSPSPRPIRVRLNFGSSGTGAVNHLCQALFAQRAGIEVVHVPFAAARRRCWTCGPGRIQAMFAAVQEALPVVREGATRGLAISSAERSPLLPEVPPVADTLPGFDVVFWQGLFAPAGTPEPVVARLGAALRAATEDAALRARMAEQGVSVQTGDAATLRDAARAGNRELGPADPGGRHQARVRAPPRPCRVPRGHRIIGAISAAAREAARDRESSVHARPDAGPSAADLRHPGARGAQPSGGEDRERPRGRQPGAAHLAAGGGAGRAARARAGGARGRAGRAGRDARLERPPAPGGLLRHLVHGRGAAHGEPAPFPGPDRLHPGGCGGHAPPGRPDPAAGAGGAGGPAAALAPRRGGDGGGGADPGRRPSSPGGWRCWRRRR